ncbi:phage tail tube protein [Tistrella mobilis]|uniref:phage tail tube protein n=1 Tax=Tistrella mobilis TaxID=171437 RepID=UPI0035579A73
MAYTWRRKTILAKLESGYAVDAAPTGTSDAIETENLAITPLQHGLAERNIDDGRLGNRGGFMVGRNVQVTFDVAFAGAGEAGTVPAYGSLLKACGMSEDIVTDESVAYAPIDDLPPSATLYVNVDGVRHAVTGARGNLAIRMTVDQIPYLAFTFIGLFVPVTGAAMPAVSLSGFTTPVPVGPVATAVAFDAVSLGMQSLELDMGNDIQYVALTDAEKIERVARSGTATITAQMPQLATRNFFSDAAANTTGVVSITHGTEDGARVGLTLRKVQITDITYQEISGTVGLQMQLALLPTPVASEFAIIVR